MCLKMLLLTLLWTWLAVWPAARAALGPPHILDDDHTQLRLSLADLEREQEQRVDLNRPPLLPNHYDWHPSIAASVPPSYIHDAARLEHNERLRQLQLQHQQLSAGYALPAYLPGEFLQLSDGNVSPTTATTAITPTTITTVKSGARLLKPIVPFDLDLQLQLNGVHYLNGNALPSATTLVPHPVQRPVTRPLRPPITFIQQPPLHVNPNPSAHPSPPNIPHLLQQSKQFAYAPLPQRNYAAAPRIPLPFPPSFVSITTRRPAAGYANGYGKPFRPSQPDPTPDLFAGRDSKSLLESYIPSWEVLRIYQQHQPQQQQQHQNQLHQSHQYRPVQRHTLAYAVPGLRLFKRDSMLDRLPERSRIVKKALGKNSQP